MLFVKWRSMANLKDEILNVAIDRMQQVGIRSVSIDDICHEMGISKKTFYVYFPSKEDLIGAILQIHEQKVATELAHAMQRRNIAQCIVEWSKIAKQTEKSTVKTPPMIYDLEKYYTHIFAEHKRIMRQTTEKILVQFLQKGINEGIFRKEIDVQIVAMIFLDIQYKLMSFMAEGKKTREEIHRIGHQGMDILMRGILTTEGLETLKTQIEK